MKKKVLIVFTIVLFLLIPVTILYLFQEGYLYTSKSSRLESISKKESKFRGRFIGEYIPNKKKLKLCNKTYDVPNIWVEKYRTDLEYLNFFMETDIDFRNHKIDYYILDNSHKSGIGYGSTKNKYALIYRNKNSEEVMTYVFNMESDLKCSDTIVFTKSF